MSNLAVVLFAHLQDAEFYQRLHQEAAAMLHDGHGRTWLDAGCGPGGLTRVASQKGYAARGIDRDPRMIAAARRLAANRNSPATFDVADLDTIAASGERFDAVSASSLLVVLPDPKKALLQLQAFAKPGGTVLIVEASRGLTRTRAAFKILSGRHGRRAYMLQVWATVRSGRTLSDSVFDQAEMVTRRPLLDGLANGWMIKLPALIERDNAGSEFLT